MNITILAERSARALQTIKEHAPALSEKFPGIPGDVFKQMTASNKDKAVENMLRMEAVARFMALASAVPVPSETPTDNGTNGEPVPYILDFPAKEAIENVKAVADLGALSEMAAYEANNKKRKSVISVIEARIAELMSQAEV
jgi:hypothetical protein